MIPDGYKKRGILLSLPWDAAFMLVEKGVGDFDCLGDGEGDRMGVAVPGHNIASFHPGDVPAVVVSPGGFVVVREAEGDVLAGRTWLQEGFVDDLFDEPAPDPRAVRLFPMSLP